MTLRLTSLEDLAFPLPHGVIEAERLRLSPAIADAALIGELRRNAASDRIYIGELEANGRAQSDIIRDLQADLHVLEAIPTLTLARSLGESESIATLSHIVGALVDVGNEVVMKFELVGDRRTLNVYVRSAA